MGALTETYTLSNGNQIPKIGFGTWLLDEGDESYDAVSDALRLGYRHIDTAGPTTTRRRSAGPYATRVSRASSCTSPRSCRRRRRRTTRRSRNSRRR